MDEINDDMEITKQQKHLNVQYHIRGMFKLNYGQQM